MIPTEAQLLSIHVAADERYEGKRLYEAIVETARAMKLAGASVFPGRDELWRPPTDPRCAQ